MLMILNQCVQTIMDVSANGLDNGKYTIEFVREFDRRLTIANYSGVTVEDGLWWKVRTFHQFIPDYTRPEIYGYCQKKD